MSKTKTDRERPTGAEVKPGQRVIRRRAVTTQQGHLTGTKRQPQTVSVPDNLTVALQQAEAYAVDLIAMNGIHPHTVGDQVLDAVQTLAGLSLTDDDEARFSETLDALAHAYVLGVAVGLKLCGLGRAR